MNGSQISRALSLLLLLLGITAAAQPVSEKALASFVQSPRYGELRAFYLGTGWTCAWTADRAAGLRERLKTAQRFGLDPGDYRTAPAGADDDAAVQDLRLTDAALHYFGDLKTGNRQPALAYNGLAYAPDARLGEEGLRLLQRGDLDGLERTLRPRTKAYGVLLATLQRMLQLQQDTGFAERHIQATGAAPALLAVRLYQLGVLSTPDSGTGGQQLTAAIGRAQALFGQAQSGRMTPALAAALNVPLRTRQAELAAALNLLRWLEGLRAQGRVVALNIASADLLVSEKDDTLLYSRIIAGKAATPTPTLSGTITDVVLFPFWMVPHKIATRELLPLIKASRATLDIGNLQVLDRNGRVVDPRRINWQSLGPGNFPYVLRQMSGCDNALGLVKFVFDNPFSVYLHDTPTKELFSNNRRFYSHGCMRVEKPMELARLLLGANHRAVDTLTAKGCLYQPAPKTLRVNPVPLVVFYATAWTGPGDALRFFEDVYDRVATVPRLPDQH